MSLDSRTLEYGAPRFGTTLRATARALAKLGRWIVDCSISAATARVLFFPAVRMDEIEKLKKRLGDGPF